jgi:hypothetical protein
MKEVGRGHASISEKSEVATNDVWTFSESRVSKASGIEMDSSDLSAGKSSVCSP